MVISVKRAFRMSKEPAIFCGLLSLSRGLPGPWKSDTNDGISASYTQKGDTASVRGELLDERKCLENKYKR